MIHNYTSLPGHDKTKVRGADCITASKSDALDVRVLKIAESIAVFTTVLRDQRGYSTATNRLFQDALALREIAAEIRDAATPSRNEIAATRDAATLTELRDVWIGTAARRLEMEPVERIMLLERALGRLLVIEARHEGDGR